MPSRNKSNKRLSREVKWSAATGSEIADLSMYLFGGPALITVLRCTPCAALSSFFLVFCEARQCSAVVELLELMSVGFRGLSVATDGETSLGDWKRLCGVELQVLREWKGSATDCRATVGGSEQGVGGIEEGTSAKKNTSGKSNRVTKS